ncbi:MAG: SDR family oxidoreductase [Gammaproteobacteria bacterium]|nr:SDR family oxidoreductase [Gammaproteobacteria bacterium]
MNSFNGKSVLVTGAASGVGKALSIELASRGAEVFVTALTGGEARPVAEAIVATGGLAHAMKCDVTENEDIRNAIDVVVQQCGKLDLIINNAGLLYIGEFTDMDEAFLKKIYGVNFTAVSMGCYFALKQMKKQGHGHIVNIASMAGLLPSPGMAAYASSKHGVVGLSKSLQAECTALGIKVQVACLSNVESDLIDGAECKTGHNDVYRKLFPKPQTSAGAAKKLADGMRSSRLFLYSPFNARVAAAVYRISPRLMQWSCGLMMKLYREDVQR